MTSVASQSPYQNLYRRMPLPKKAILKMMGSKSDAKFVSDTLVNWAPKMVFTVRSWVEAAEVSFLEFVESGFFYYSPNLSGSLLRNTFHKIAPDLSKKGEKKFPLALLGKSIEEIKKNSPEYLKQVLPVKAGLILTSCAAVGIAGEYALNFVKNLLSLHVFNKSDFSDIVNLEHNVQKQTANHQKVKIKAFRRLKEIGLISLSVLGSCLLLARFGHRLNGVKLFGKIEALPLLEKFVQKFDFKFNKAGKIGLSNWQLYSIIGFGALGYVDAARDKTEFWEIFRRMMIVPLYLMKGQELIMDLLSKPLAKRFLPQLLNPANPRTLKGEIHKILNAGPEAISDKALERAAELFKNSNVTQADINREASKILEPYLNLGMVRHTLSLILGSIGVGVFVTRMSQFCTKRRVARLNMLEERQYPLQHQRSEFLAFKQKMFQPVYFSSARYPDSSWKTGMSELYQFNSCAHKIKTNA